MKYFDTFYLDLEKDIVIDFYLDKNNYYYILRTPNHSSGNLIRNLASICKLPLSMGEDGLLQIRGKVPTYVNEENKHIHILKFNNKTVAVINSKGNILPRALVPAISKTLMSQTKKCDLALNDVLIRTYIEEEFKFKTDVHTHMNANLYPDILIALGIYHQIRYPYYYIKKLGLKLNDRQYKMLENKREKVAGDFTGSNLGSNLVGKYLDRKIDDNTFINFADLILNNYQDAAYNINKIRVSLSILKDGQAVFTNLEKLYLYRYVFAKGIDSDKKITLKNIDKIQDKDVSRYLNKMLLDASNPDYKDNTLLEDKLLWIARMYKALGINYVEISNTTLVKGNEEMLKEIKSYHKILPLAYKETGVKISFLAALRRIPLTIVKDKITSDNYLRNNLDVLKAVCKDPYVVGADFVGEEINDIGELEPVIRELVAYSKTDPYFTIRIHAGENDSLKDNVTRAVDIVLDSLDKGQKMPKLRIGHGIYTTSLKTKKGKDLIRKLKQNNVILEFQLTSNVRLNNLTVLDAHPIKEFLKNGVSAVQGSDGCGIYGTNSLDEELALRSLLKLDSDDFKLMCATEDKIIKDSEKSFDRKTKLFNPKNKDIGEYIKDLIEINKTETVNLAYENKDIYLSSDALKDRIKDFPLDKMPIILAGGSFNQDNRSIKLDNFQLDMLDELLYSLDPKKFYFVVGHKISGYEKYLIDHNRGFEIYAIVPHSLTSKEIKKIEKTNIYCVVSTENLGMGIYKSFNYEIFERRPSIVLAIDGNSACANLIQEAKNGKAKALIYVSGDSEILKAKAMSLIGYVNIYYNSLDIKIMIKKFKRKARENGGI